MQIFQHKFRRWDIRDGKQTKERFGFSIASLGDIDKDYSCEMKESIDRAIRGLFTPLHGVCDETEVQRLMCKVNTYVADGASPAQKCGAIMQEQGGGFPNLYLVMRGPAHQLRISTMDPLKHHTEFADFWHRIFDDRHALVPDLQNSSTWKERLLLSQKHILQKQGSLGGGLSVPLRALSFAKQRFDSTSAPVRTYCAMLAAIAVALATIVADVRTKSCARSRAQS